MPEDGIDMLFPLSMDIQTAEEFKKQVLKEVDEVAIPINGFMMKEIDKTLNQGL